MNTVQSHTYTLLCLCVYRVLYVLLPTLLDVTVVWTYWTSFSNEDHHLQWLSLHSGQDSETSRISEDYCWVEQVMQTMRERKQKQGCMTGLLTRYTAVWKSLCLGLLRAYQLRDMAMHTNPRYYDAASRPYATQIGQELRLREEQRRGVLHLRTWRLV